MELILQFKVSMIMSRGDFTSDDLLHGVVFVKLIAAKKLFVELP